MVNVNVMLVLQVQKTDEYTDDLQMKQDLVPNDI